MTDLTCQECSGDGVGDKADPRFRWPICGACGGCGRRLPELREWDALLAERDSLRRELDEARITIRTLVGEV